MIASVASFFVSRIDTAVDQELERIGATDLQGKIAIASAKTAYARFREIFSSERWRRLAALRTHVQRPLWGSTSTKNPNYPDTLYVDNLIGADTVNTLPPITLEAFLDHGRVALTLQTGLEQARYQLSRLHYLGVDLDAITQGRKSLLQYCCRDRCMVGIAELKAGAAARRVPSEIPAASRSRVESSRRSQRRRYSGASWR